MSQYSRNRRKEENLRRKTYPTRPKIKTKGSKFYANNDTNFVLEFESIFNNTYLHFFPLWCSTHLLHHDHND